MLEQRLKNLCLSYRLEITKTLQGNIMPLAVGQIHTINSLKAVSRVESAVRKEGLNLSFDIPREFIEKRNYMCSEEFLNDTHNVKMFGLIDKLVELRDKISSGIVERNKTSKDEIVQGINGFSRVKKYLNLNYKMNFSENQTFHTPEENEYWILRQFQIYNLARQAKNKLGIK